MKGLIFFPTKSELTHPLLTHDFSSLLGLCSATTVSFTSPLPLDLTASTRPFLFTSPYLLEEDPALQKFPTRRRVRPGFQLQLRARPGFLRNKRCIYGHRAHLKRARPGFPAVSVIPQAHLKSFRSSRVSLLRSFNRFGMYECSFFFASSANIPI